MPFFLEEKDYTIVGKSFCIDDLYCLPINYNSSNFVYEYSILTGNQKIADLNGKFYTDGGYLYDIATRKILKLEEGVNQLLHTILRIQQKVNSDLDIEGVLLTM